MANISKIITPNGNEYNLKDSNAIPSSEKGAASGVVPLNSSSKIDDTYLPSIYLDDIEPIKSKTYSGIIGTANDWAGATFFFGKIIPSTWYAIWKIKYRIRAYVPGKNAYDQIADVMISGDQGSMRAYASLNTVSTYLPAYYHELYRLKSAGFNNGYGHLLGLTLRSSSNPTASGYERTIVVDIYETQNCTFDFFDSYIKYENAPGTGTTNYDSYTEMNFCTNGLQETGDSDTITQNRVQYTYRKAYTVLYRYQILLSRFDGTLLPVNAVENNTGTGKTLTTESFDPFGEIFFYNTTTTTAVNAVIPNNTLYRQCLVDLRFSFNTGTTLVAYKPVFIVASPQSDGSAKLHSSPISQDFPSSDDGLIYIFLGYVYAGDTNKYRIEFYLEHPVYWYKNGKVQQYLPNSGTVNGHTIEADVPSGASFTDTKNTAGATDTSSKIFLIGATAQTANPQTYSHDTAYVGTNGKLYSGGNLVLVGGSNASSSVSITPSTTDVYSMTSAGSVTAGTANTPTVIDTTKFSGGSFTRGSFSGGSFTQGTDSFTANTPTVINTSKFSAGSFTQGTDSFSANTPTVIDTTKFSGGSFTRGTFSGGSFTQGTDSFTANTPTVINTSKFSGGSFTRGAFSGGSFTQGTDSFTAASLQSGFYTAGTAASFTRGTFSQGTLPTLTLAVDSTDTKQLNITFGQGTLPTHAADSFTANTPTVINTSKFSGGSFTQGTDSFTAATHAADSFTAASLQSGFYTAGTAASFTQGTDSFTAATHAADSFTAAKLNSGFYTAGTAASFTQGTDSFTAPSLQTGFYTAGTAASFTQGTDSFTAATHAADSFTAAKLNSGFYTAGTANTPTAVTLPGRSSVIKAWTGYTAATAAAQTFTGTS